MLLNHVYPSACYNPFSLSSRQNFPPLNELFPLTSRSSDSQNDPVIDDGLPHRVFFDIDKSRDCNDIFTAHERAILEKREDALALANAAWWQEVLTESVQHADREDDVLPIEVISGAELA